MKTTNYYESQLNKIEQKGEFAPKLKVSGANDKETHWLDINEESAKELVKWLQTNFIKRKLIDDFK
jgi:hypothetical protein